MSQAGTTTAVAPVAAAVKAELSPTDAFVAKYEKKGKVSIRFDATDDERTAFFAAVKQISEDATQSFKDWSVKAPETGFNSAALVRQETSGDNTFITIADKDTAFADNTVSAYLYRLYMNKIVGSVDADDAQEASFITVAGCFSQKFDIEAFKSSARFLVQVLHKRGLSGITVAGLKQAFSNSAFATSQFPRVPKEAWPQLINLAIAYAERKGYDVSIFTYWLATRDAVVDEGETIDLSDMAALQKDVDDVIAEKTTDKETAKPAETPAPAAAATA